MTNMAPTGLEQAITDNDWGQGLAELVHDVASQAASAAVNSGTEVEFLRGRGWTDAEIRDALAESSGQDAPRIERVMW